MEIASPYVLVVGSGVCGLTCAYLLGLANIQVLVIEKARGIGGRLSNRKLSLGQFDLGMQQISTELARQPFVSKMLPKLKIEPPFQPKNLPSGHAFAQALFQLTQQTPRAPKFLFQTKCLPLEPSPALLQVQTDPPLELKPKFCILTAPAPQVAQLFSPFAESLQTISYFSQWVLASFFDPAFNPSSLFHAQTPEYDSHPLGSLGSIASIVRLHPLILQSEKSLQDWHKENPAPEMQEAQKLILESYPKALLSSHTWRYSQPVRSLLSDFLMIPGLPIFAAGDSFGNSVYPLERSLSSAFATTQAIINLFSHT